jgi:hypothetical protein
MQDDEEMKRYMGAFSPKVPVGATNYVASKDFPVRVLPTTVSLVFVIHSQINRSLSIIILMAHI